MGTTVETMEHGEAIADKTFSGGRMAKPEKTYFGEVVVGKNSIEFLPVMTKAEALSLERRNGWKRFLVSLAKLFVQAFVIGVAFLMPFYVFLKLFFR